MKPSYKSNTTLDAKLENLPIRRNPNMSQATSSSSESNEDNCYDEEENVDPSWMEYDDIFMEDHEVFVSLGLRAEDEAARLNLEQDGVDLNAQTTEISGDDNAQTPGAKKQQRCHKCGEFWHRETGNCPLNEPKKRQRKPQQKRKPKRPKTMPADTISPGSLTRRIINLVHGDDETGPSSSTSSAKRLLVLSPDQGGGPTSTLSTNDDK